MTQNGDMFSASFALAKSRAGGTSIKSVKYLSLPPAAPAVGILGVAGNKPLNKDLPHRVKPPCRNACFKQFLPRVKVVFLIRSQALNFYIVGVRARIVRQYAADGCGKTSSPYAWKRTVFSSRNKADVRAVDFCRLRHRGLQKRYRKAHTVPAVRPSLGKPNSLSYSVCRHIPVLQ